MSRIEFRDVTVTGTPTGDRAPAPVILDGVSAVLTERRIGVVGANGSGKSTLLRLINGLVTPAAGQVLVDGLDVAAHLREVRRRVGFVFSNPAGQMIMPTPREDVELSLRGTGVPRAARRARAEALLADAGLAGRAEASVFSLSSGQQQLLALTSVLAVGPAILVCDEPTTLLDLRNARRFARRLAGLDQQVVVAGHDLDLMAGMDRVLVVEAGRIVCDAPPTDALAFYRAGQDEAPGVGQAGAGPSGADPARGAR